MKTVISRGVLLFILILITPPLLDILAVRIARELVRHMETTERDLKVEWLHDLGQRIRE